MESGKGAILMTAFWNQISKRERVYLVLILAVLLLIGALLLLRPRADTAAEAAVPAMAAPEEPRVVVKEVEKLVTVEKAIEAETIQDGLNEMGVLITAEYWFKDLVSFSSVKKFLKTELVLPFTESSYLVSYEGAVSAGIDLSAARVEKDDERMRVTVYLPAASIQGTDIDLDSFTLHEEKSALGNPLSVQDFNDSLRELERSAEQNALSRGLLEKADRNARTVIAQFIGGLVGSTAYSLAFETM